MSNKKAQETKYIVFIALFLCLFSVLAGIFKTNILEQETQDKSTVENIVSSITSMIIWVGDNTVGRLPVVSTFWTMVSSTINLRYIQPYLGNVYLVFFGIPLGYIVLRLIRGGG